MRLSAVNRAASAAGILAGAYLADARAMLPTLTVAPADPLADRAALRGLARWLGRYGIARNAYGLIAESPSGHPLRCYGLWVDISGVAHLYGGEGALLADLEAQLLRLGFTAQAGLADTLGAAHALAWHGGPSCMAAPGRIAPSGATLPAIARLPVSVLRLDRACVQLLHRLGFKEIGALAHIPRMALERRFRSRQDSERVLLRLDQAMGLKDEPRRPLVEPPVLSVQQLYGEPLISSEALENEVKALVARFCNTLDLAGTGAQAAVLRLYRCDGTLAEVAIAFARAVRSPEHVHHLLAEKLNGLDLGFGVDLLSLDAVRVQKLTPSQASLTHGSKETMAGFTAQLIDRLVNRLGPQRIVRLEPCATHWPERADARVEAQAPHGRGWSVFGARPVIARPALLLAPPEPITVMAEIPEGAPVHFTWRRVKHNVVRAGGPERIEPEWWRQLPQQPGPRTRDYYALEDEAGGRFWVFRDGRYADEEGLDAPPAWFVHGVFA